jgi:nitrogen fixation/metabolism regulation signal transduction histidine kinase
MPVGFKLTAIFILVVLAPMLLLAFVSYRVIDARLMEHAREEVSNGVKAAWTEYFIRGEQMRYGMLQAASMEEIKKAVVRGDAEYLRKVMTQWRQMRPYVDIWAITDGNGRVIARINSQFRGDSLLLGGLLAHALSSKTPQVSTEIIPADVIKLEGNSVSGISSLQDGMGSGADDVLALTVVTPVLDERQAPVGAIVTADVLNNDSFVPDMVSYKFPDLFTTITAGGTRIATNLAAPGGGTLRGTRVEAEVASIINGGNPAFAEWGVMGLTLISKFEPIKDYRGNVIGFLDVGLSKERTWVIQKGNQKALAIVTLLGLSFSILAALISARRITRPLKELKEKLSVFGAGDFDARIDLAEFGGYKGREDELSVLAGSFNKMMDDVNRREAEKGRYLKEIEQKGQAFAGLNENLRVANEELEIAYEETQSQTEELHAINEELKLLNEDLDRKNLELQKANRTITREEEALKAARNKLRLIYDSIRDYVLQVGYDYSILEANRHFLEMAGLTEQSVIGRGVYEVFGAATPARGNCPIRKSIDFFSPAEIEMTTPEGKVLVWQSYPITGGDDAEPKSAVVYIQDVTEKRLLTQKLIQSDKLSSLGELVSGVAHELNNPLTGIMCFSELLIEERLGKSAEAKLRKINDASHRCKKIIDNLLTFARWKRPEKKYDDINRIIKESVEFRAYQLSMDNIELRLDLSDAVPGTMVDASQIQQVLLNLINNARDAIRETGPSGRIEISSALAAGKIAVSVTDTGKGFSEEVANRLFDPFFTTKDVGKGTGLGLSISYGIINEHGGNIYASSRPRIGTTFVIELPVVEEEGDYAGAPEAPSVADRVSVSVENMRALVLDDEAIVLDLLADSLAGFGFEVDKCSSAEDALKRIADSCYHLIISDIKMPGLGGKGFYREVEKVNPAALKKIIFISGDSIGAETQEFLEAIGNPSLKKPFSINELSEAVARMVL